MSAVSAELTDTQPGTIIMLVIHASELAACIGMHRYRSVPDAVVTIFERLAPDAYKQSLARNKLLEKPAIETTISSLPKTTATTLTEAIKAEPDAAVQLLDNVLTSKEISRDPALADDLRTFVYTERGKLAEDSSLNRAEVQLGKPIQQRNMQYFKKVIEYAPGQKLQLGGKVDGITEDGQLVEMKNRQRQLFTYVPVYERVQVHAYMHLTDISECRLIQNFKETTSTSIVTFSEEFWSEIVRRLSLVAKRLDQLFTQSDVQDALLVSGEFPVDFEDDAVEIMKCYV